MNIRTALLAAACLLAALPTAAAARETYKVSAVISHSGTVLASPILVVEPGRKATVSTTGPEACTLAVTVDAAADGALRLTTDLRSPHGDMAPVVVLAPGRPGSVAVGELSMTLTAMPEGG